MRWRLGSTARIRLVLSTCHPVGSARQRLVVTAEMSDAFVSTSGSAALRARSAAIDGRRWLSRPDFTRAHAVAFDSQYWRRAWPTRRPRRSTTNRATCGRALTLVQSSRAGTRTFSWGDPFGQRRTQFRQRTQSLFDSTNMTCWNIGQPSTFASPL